MYFNQDNIIRIFSNHCGGGEEAQICHFEQLFCLFIKNICRKYLHYETKNLRNILCVGTLFPSVQLWLKLHSYCSFVTKVPVDTIRMIRGMDVAYHFFISPVAKVSIWQLWTARRMEICLARATKCCLSEGILPTGAETGRKSQEMAVKSI